MSYDGSILDHLAEYLIYLSSSSSFWFSLNSSYDNEFHLSCGSQPSSLSYKMGLLYQEKEVGPLHRGPSILIKTLHGHIWNWLQDNWLKFVYQWSVSSAQGNETIYLDWHNQRLLSQKNWDAERYDNRMMVIPPRLNGLLYASDH